jgi:hypothetical protein
MNSMLGRYAAFAIVAVLQGGAMTLAHGQSTTAPGAAGGTPQSRDDSGPGSSAPSDEVTASVDLPVLYVTSVEILQTASDPKIDVVSVTGLVASEGWTFPQLVPTYAGKPFDDVLDLQFIATTPAQSQPASGFVAVSAVFPLEPGQWFKGVRVRAAENAISVLQVPGSNRSAAQVNDCKDCLGKRFAPTGQAQPSEQGVVRQEDLPKALRVIRPMDGIRGADQDPDRLTLMLDDKGTIVEAFWE